MNRRKPATRAKQERREEAERMMKKVLIIMAAVLMLLPGAEMVKAAGSQEMPGGYVQPPVKTAPEAREFVDSLNNGTAQPATTGAEGTVQIRKITIEGDDPLKLEAEKILADKLNRQYNIKELNKLSEQLTQYYRSHDYPVALVYLPPQKITGGTVRFAVLPGRYDQIILENNTVIKDSAIMRQAYAIESGGYITATKLEKAISLVNDLSLAAVQATLSPGSKPGTANLTMKVVPDGQNKYGGNVTIDNLGSQYTGRNEAGLGLYMNNVSGNGDIVALNGLTGYQEQDGQFRTATGTASYRMPTAFWNGDFGINASYVQYTLGGTFANMQVTGSSWIESANWTYMIERSLYANQNIQTRITVKQLENQTGISSGWDRSQVYEAGVSYGGNRINRDWYNGYTTYNIGITAGSWQQAASATNILYSGPFQAFISGEAYHQIYLSDKWTIDGDLSGQWAWFNNLNPTDSFALGGYSGVKAYPQGYAAGSSGALAKVNVRYNIPWKPAEWFPDWQVKGFMDAGIVNVNLQPYAGQTVNAQSIGDYGVGLTMMTGGGISIEMDYALKMYYWDNSRAGDESGMDGNDGFLLRAGYRF